MLAEGSELAHTFMDAIRAEQNKVRAVMSQGVTTVTEETPAREIASLMHSKNFKRVPVTRNGRLVGIVARSDLVRALAQKLGETRGAPIAEAQTLHEALRRRRDKEFVQ